MIREDDAGAHVGVEAISKDKLRNALQAADTLPLTSVRRILDTQHLNKELDWDSAIQKRTVHGAGELTGRASRNLLAL